MTKRYTGGVVSSSLPTVNAAGASGVFLLSQQSDYQSRNAWPPYKIEESLRFRASATGYLSRTPSVAGNQKTWTWSAWVKRGSLGANRTLMHAYDGSASRRAQFYFDTSDQFVMNQGGSASSAIGTSTALFRDPSAWYHIVLTANYGSSAFTFYVNGVAQAMTYSTSVNNENGQINGNWAHQIGSQTTSNLFDGYMSEVNFIDGQALTPSSFGATDKDGNWSPIAYTGTYGTNGFYLNFKDSTSAATTGYDYSGNGNNWTLSGFNVSTANTSYDIMIDVPEDQAGANNRGSYCTLNPLSFYNSQSNSINCTNGNLNIKAHTANGDTRTFGTMGVSTGKWYFESNIVAVDSTYGCVGISDIILAHGQSQNVGNWWVYIADGKKYNGVNPAVGGSAYGNTFTTNDIIGIAVDLDNSKIWFSKNGTYQASGDPVAGTNAAFTNVAGTIYPAVYTWAINSEQAFNFGQRPFTYAPPSGFKTLNTFNLPEPTIKQPNRHFDVVTYTGDGNSTKSITGVNFQPGFAWVKSRSNAQINVLSDVLRGMPNRTLRSDSTDTEQTFGGGNIQSLDSNGITVSYGSVGVNTNESGYTYVAWQWNAGTANTTNTSGSITSTVRVNQAAGFSVVTYTGNATGGATVGHGLGVAPSMVILKSRTVATNWYVYHSGLTSAQYQVYLNLTSAQDDTGFTALNDKAPTSTVFELPGTGYGSNNSGATYVAYCFAPIAGYSAFGSYTGNGSTDGPFIHTGFRPRFVMWKNSSAAEAWLIEDAARSTYNQVALELYPSSSGAEAAGSSRSPTQQFDFLSNGFKVRGAQEQTNGSGNTIIYAAFAEMPFKYSRSR